VNLATQVERWKRFWRTSTDPAEVERQLERLRWLEDFAFRCGPEITRQDFQALEGQIENGERRLSELNGIFQDSGRALTRERTEQVQSELFTNSERSELRLWASFSN
jgi:hypothetical protein